MGAAGLLSSSFFSAQYAAVLFDHLHGRHQGEGLALPVFEAPQAGYGRRASRAAGEVITADALDGHDLALLSAVSPPRPADLP